MPSVVADANVLISAALARSPNAPSVLILDAALDGRLELITSPALLREIADVLARPRLRKYLSTDEALRLDDSTPPPSLGPMAAPSIPTPALLGSDDLLAVGNPLPASDSNPVLQVQYAEAASGEGGMGFDVGITDEGLAGQPGVSAFRFDNTGPGDVEDSTLGTGSITSNAIADLVDAYFTSPPGSTPAQLAYFSYTFNPGIPPSPQSAWSGPTALGSGALPRLASGPAGMFLLSLDGAALNKVQIRPWSQTSQSFSAPDTLEQTTTSSSLGGGVGESQTTGQVAVVWPQISAGQLQLFITNPTDPSEVIGPLDIAGIDDGYEGLDNARVAVAGAGTGWVTFRDGKGLEVANLVPYGLDLAGLRVNPSHVFVPVPCGAVKGLCNVTLSLMTGNGKIVASDHASFSFGTKLLDVPLSALGIRRLRAAHGNLPAILKLRISSAGAPPYRLSTKVTVGGRSTTPAPQPDALRGFVPAVL